MASGHLSRTAAAVVACALLMVASLPAASTFPYVPEEHTFLREVASWRDPGGRGADLGFELNKAGDRLLLVGYGAPGEVRVTDLHLGNATVLEPPEPGFMAAGADWSMSERYIGVWGEPVHGPPFAIYDVPSYQLNTTAPWMDLVTLPEVTEVSFLADDIIVSVAGRDAHGTSHLMFIEAHQDAVRWDHIWQGNHTVLEVEDTGRELVIADSGGTITHVLGHNWNEFVRFEGVLPGGATSWHVPFENSWGMGGAGGMVTISLDYPLHPQFNITVGQGPVTGFSWTLARHGDFVAAERLPGGGSRLEGWQTSPELFGSVPPTRLCSLDIYGNVTMMRPDPRGWSRVLVAMDDGTLASYKMDVRPKPRWLLPDDPDEPDGRGLEPFAAWHMEGEPDIHNMHFAFNHAGSLIALRGFDGQNDLRVIDRTFGLVAEIDVPKESFELHGYTWSSTDRWFVYWGVEMKDDEHTIVMRAFDVPSFNESTSFDPEMVTNVTFDIWDMLFLPGDDVVVLFCSNGTHPQVVMLLDLSTGEVLSTVPVADVFGFPELQWDGDNMVAVSPDDGVFTLSPPYDGLNRTGLGPTERSMDFDVNGSSGWCFVGESYNVTIMNGTPREEVLRFQVKPDHANNIAWTGVPGDFVLGMHRLYYGTSLQLWRLGAGEEGDWRSVDGARMLTELNASRDIRQMEADPAFPGIVAVSFTDGTLALYHLNLTPYPPPPEELGGLDINPRLPPPEEDNTTDGNVTDDGWGSEWDWVFPVSLLSAIVVLVAVLVVLRVRTDREEEEEGD